MPTPDFVTCSAVSKEKGAETWKLAQTGILSLSGGYKEEEESPNFSLESSERYKQHTVIFLQNFAHGPFGAEVAS